MADQLVKYDRPLNKFKRWLYERIHYTIVFWDDGTKIVVQTREGDTFDHEKGLAMAISKKMLGNKYEYYNVFKHWLKKVPKTTENCDIEAQWNDFVNAEKVASSLADIVKAFRRNGGYHL